MGKTEDVGDEEGGFVEEDQDILGETTDSHDEDDGAAWRPPESWAVMDPLRHVSPQPGSVVDPEKLTAIRVFKPENRTRSVPDASADLDGFDATRYSTLTILCSIDASTTQVCVLLAKRFLSARDSARYRLYVYFNGIERMLGNDEQPGILQKQWLEQIGFTDADEPNQLGREDHKYLFRFVFRELPLNSIPRTTAEEATAPDRQPPLRGSGTRRANINPKSASLANENLAVVPVAIFEYARTMECIDFSRNCLLELPSDLFETLAKLRVLHLRGNFLHTIPPAILHSRTLTQLSLAHNSLEDASLEPLAQLSSLKWLDLSGNRVKTLPDSLSGLTYITHLILSSNFLPEIPKAVFCFTLLRLLDISFNRIGSVPDEIEQLDKLSSLLAAGNSITSVSENIEKLKFLHDVDLRGNKVNELGGLLQCDTLSTLHCDHNSLYSLKNPKWAAATYLALSNNKLTSVELSFVLPSCQFVDLSRCQIAVLPDDFFEFLPKLATLILSDNELVRLPSSIGTVDGLEAVVVGNNRITDISSIPFEQLRGLTLLDIHGNNLEALPETIWLAESLKTLNASSNLLTRFPSPPMSLESPPLARKLENLSLAENRLKDDAIDAIQVLKELRVLNLSMNDLYDVADGLRTLTKLQMLFLSSNSITSLPEEIDKLRSLKQLFVNGNKLQSLPAELGKCLSLEVFDASANSLKYNISNWPYDWNWSWNLELQSLDLSDNRRLEIRPTQMAAMSIRGSTAVRPSTVSNSNPLSISTSEFKTLSKLHYLNLTNVSVNPVCMPEESTSLRVRASIPVHQLGDATEKDERIAAILQPLSLEVEVPPVGVAYWCGPLNQYDIYDFQLRKYLGHSKDHLIGLFDGRGSPLVSGLLYDRFDNFLHAELNKLKPDEDITNAIRRAFLWINGDISNFPQHSKVGASIVVLYTVDQVLYAANVGDAMAVLCRNGTATVVTTKHHAWNREEAQRVQTVGGYVSMKGLVNDELEITRAMGYHHLLPAVNASPSIRAHELTEQCEFVVVGTQEVWHYLPPQTAVDIVRTCNDDYSAAARKLRDLVISHGSSSSFAVLVVGLQEMFASSSTGKREGRKERRRRGFQESAGDLVLARLEAEISPPEGEVAIVFTDIKDSTTLWQMFPAPMRVAIRIHNTIMRRLLRVVGGYEVKNDGDSFMATFTTADKALRWCILIQRELLDAEWPQEILDCPLCAPILDPIDTTLLFRGLSVRMGAHIGTPFYRERDPMSNRMDYFGIPVIIAARLEAHSKGGQTLVSDALFQKFAASTDDASVAIRSSLGVIDIGETPLKGLETPQYARAIYPKELVTRHQYYP